MPLEIEVLSPKEVETIWKAKARAENFAEYVEFMNARNLGESFRINVKDGDSPAAIKRNFTEAAKERKTKTTDGVETDAPVLLRWKADTAERKQIVTDDKGKKTEKLVKVTTQLTALVIATDAVKKRGPRKAKTDVETPAESTPNGEVAKEAVPATA